MTTTPARGVPGGAGAALLLLLLSVACTRPVPEQATLPTATAAPAPAAATPAIAPTLTAAGLASAPTPAFQPRPSPAAPTAAAAAAATEPTTPENTATTARQTPWVRARVAAIEAIWGFSAAGRKWIESYDLRQMAGQPTWFGSTGANGWAGVGQAIPRTIMHELGHSYWGAFPVAGRPDLSWTPGPAGAPPPALLQYRADLRAFMRQPPDRFEPLRDRFRNLPGLFEGDYPDLYHFGEADLTYLTGGNLRLIPPILRKYVSAFYTDDGVGAGRFEDWAGALGWFQSLQDDDRRVVGEVFGIQHFPLEKYEALASPRNAARDGGAARIAGLLAGEEEQRLRDFAAQFDEVKERQFSLVDAAGVDRGFQFWRDYIREMRDLYRRHPGALRDSGSDRGRQLAGAFDFYAQIEPLAPAEQAARVRPRLGEPVVGDLVVLLPARALVELFAGSDSAAPSGLLGGAAAGYAGKLERLVRVADAVEKGASRSGRAGAAVFEEFVGGLDDDALRSSLNVLVDLVREADPGVLEKALPELDDETLLRVLNVRPEVARSPEIPPARLLEAAGVADGAPVEQLIRGVSLLVGHSSGNFAIDRPSEEAVYELLDRRARTRPGDALRVFRETGLRLAPWIEGHPDSVKTVMWSDLAGSAELIRSADGIRVTPEALVHLVALADPALAATLLAELQSAGDAEIAPRVMNHLAYDAYWSDLRAGPPVSLEQDAAFIEQLVRIKGAEWTLAAMSRGFRLVRDAIDNGELEPQFVEQRRDTLTRLAGLNVSDETRDVLLRTAALAGDAP